MHLTTYRKLVSVPKNVKPLCFYWQEITSWNEYLFKFKTSWIRLLSWKYELYRLYKHYQVTSMAQLLMSLDLSLTLSLTFSLTTVTGGGLPHQLSIQKVSNFVEVHMCMNASSGILKLNNFLPTLSFWLQRRHFVNMLFKRGSLNLDKLTLVLDLIFETQISKTVTESPLNWK